MLDDRDDLAIVEGILGMTAAFGKEAVAEGVERPEHNLLLLRLGCSVVQGYAIARPMPLEPPVIKARLPIKLPNTDTSDISDPILSNQA